MAHGLVSSLYIERTLPKCPDLPNLHLCTEIAIKYFISVSILANEVFTMNLSRTKLKNNNVMIGAINFV